MPRFNIHHVTRYLYNDPVRDSANQIMLYPVTDEFQEVIRQQIKITGSPKIELYKDFYGNDIGTFTYAAPHKEMVIDSRVEVLVSARPMPEDTTDKDEQWQHIQSIRYEDAYIDFIRQERFEALAEVKLLPAIIEAADRTPLETAKALCGYIFEHFTYNPGATDVETTIDEVWKLKAGVCQDFAHLLVELLRVANIPARYVSGYICPNKNGMRGEGATHAWAEAYIPFYGWLGLDPTNNCMANDLHVRLAFGRNFSEVSPVKGTYKGSAMHELSVGVTVSYEDGKVAVDMEPTLTTQPVKPVENEKRSGRNSYQAFLEMQQQQQ